MRNYVFVPLCLAILLSSLGIALWCHNLMAAGSQVTAIFFFGCWQWECIKNFPMSAKSTQRA